MRARAHPNDAQRLATLQKYGVLDSGQDAAFDEIVALASEICAVPISLISLLDADRQWFKARRGIDIAETPIEQSICAHAILNGDIFEIEDTQADPRTADNPLCMGEDALRFYAGVPLIAQDGLPIGTLCVLDRKPSRLSDFQRRALQVLSRQVMNQMELRLALENQRILHAEADHRVKNSLQSIAAIVRVYARTVSDPGAREALSGIQRRIDATAALHRELQGSDGIDMIDSATYLDRVLRLLQEGAPENISFRVHCDDILLRAAQVTSIAMIVSEFVANTIKHAFPDGMPGEISVSLKVAECGSYRLDCADNGIGSAAGSAGNGRSSGIGHSLVEAAAVNLGGSVDIRLTPEGSRLQLVFSDANRTRAAGAPQRQARQL